ncbi:MAG: type II secretion system protein [Pseudomonadota bacterium]
MSPAPIRHDDGFTLMELIAVMAILAILSAVLAPSLIDAVDDAYAAAETDNLAQLADDLERYIRDTGIVPGRAVASWSAAIATTSSRAALAVQQNERGYTRSVYFDPAFVSASGGFDGYTQSSGLTAAPASPRFMVISSLSANVGVQANDTAVFNAIWDRDAGAAIVESDRLKIERRHVGGLFHRVLLINQLTSQVAYALNGSAQLAVPAASTGVDGLLSRYVIDGSELALYSGPYPTGALASAALVNADLSVRYESTGSAFEWVRP